VPSTDLCVQGLEILHGPCGCQSPPHAGALAAQARLGTTARRGKVKLTQVKCSAVQCSAVECSHVQSNATKLSVASCSRSCWPHYNGATSLIQFASWASCPSWASRPSWPGYGRAMAGLWPGSRHHCGRAACPCMRADEILDLLAQLSIRLKVHRGEGQIGERRRLVDLEPM